MQEAGMKLDRSSPPWLQWFQLQGSVIVCTYNPIALPQGSNWPTEVNLWETDLLLSSDVRLILSGHSHKLIAGAYPLNTDNWKEAGFFFRRVPYGNQEGIESNWSWAVGKLINGLNQPLKIHSPSGNSWFTRSIFRTILPSALHFLP